MWDDRKPKFIVIEGKQPNTFDVKVGMVSLHKILKPSNTKVYGGGWFYLDRENDIMVLYSESVDFGRFKKEHVIMALENKTGRFFRQFKGHTIYFSETSLFNPDSGFDKCELIYKPSDHE